MTDTAYHSQDALILCPAVVEFHHQSELVSELKPVKDGRLARCPRFIEQGYVLGSVETHFPWGVSTFQS